MASPTKSATRLVRAPAPAALGAEAKVEAGPASKRDQLLRMLSVKNGVELAAISAQFSWLPHTARAALSGLRKAGYPVVTEKRPDGKPTRYRIAAQARAALPGDGLPSAAEPLAPDSPKDPGCGDAAPADRIAGSPDAAPEPAAGAA
ncbi:DUF3489 domain-containing protein [Frigidibacter sp. RF13]|nr:DUF3489 domain-containing protein [Frigidibacter sp. RF13]